MRIARGPENHEPPPPFPFRDRLLFRGRPPSFRPEPEERDLPLRLRMERPMSIVSGVSVMPVWVRGPDQSGRKGPVASLRPVCPRCRPRSGADVQDPVRG